MAEEAEHLVHGVDFSAEMVRRARRKAAHVVPRPTFTEADASCPPLPASSFDAVVCRHVLWAMPDPVSALQAWIDLLAPGGVLVLVEGRWSNGVGLPAAECLTYVSELRVHVEVKLLTDPVYWGGPISDERYLIVSRH